VESASRARVLVVANRTAAAQRLLTEVRAKALCARLRADGVKARRTVRSAGERRPRATNRTYAGRALNRRTDLLVRYR
jgi:outer membrane protein OmpA-like peptidoglycan-associated protein